ncbi:MAG: PQQ-binding-like beta-propeller repeat protein [Lachnospiraceae bacterium]|nr:PQQ-binding-like beta-propeller repeat protein [Lachnospiraceae bacterium]
MKTIWKYPLPTDEKSRDCDYESPIYEYGNEVLFPFRYMHATVLYVIDTFTGRGTTLPLDTNTAVMAWEFFMEPFPDGVVIYAGDIFWYCSGKIKKAIDMTQYGKVISHAVWSGYIYLLCVRDGKHTLACFDSKNKDITWKLDVTTEAYTPGPIYFFEEKVTCFAHGELLFIDLEKGTVLSSIRILHANKLFCPIRLDEENLAIGFTNWTNAGILKYNLKSKKVEWKTGRKFEGPLLRCKIHRNNGNLIWVKNDRELICLDELTGAEKYRVSTLPWLYTDLQFSGDRTLFGTSGADGFLNCIRTDTGKEIWKLPLKDGCAFFKMQNDSVFVGDFSKRIMQIDIETGKILKELQTTGEVVGRIEVQNKALYTVVWGNATSNISLIKVDIGADKKSFFGHFKKNACKLREGEER